MYGFPFSPSLKQKQKQKRGWGEKRGKEEQEKERRGLPVHHFIMCKRQERLSSGGLVLGKCGAGPGAPSRGSRGPGQRRPAGGAPTAGVCAQTWRSPACERSRARAAAAPERRKVWRPRATWCILRSLPKGTGLPRRLDSALIHLRKSRGGKRIL